MAFHKVEICGLNTNDIKVISNEEMVKLFKVYTKDNSEIKDKLIKGNLKLVLSIVSRFSNRTDNMDDLFQVGCIGLIKAIDNFDLKYNVRFSTYAVPMILGEIKRYLRDNNVIRISRHLKDISYKVYKLKEEYMHTHEKEPKMEYLAQCLDVPLKDIMEAMESLQGVVSIFDPVYSSEGDSILLMDQIQDTHNEIELLSNVLTLRTSMKELSNKESDIIRKRYFDDKTQSEIANELGISQAQVSRLEKSAIECLKRNFEE